MRINRPFRFLALAGVLALLVSCGEKETPEQRTQRLRSRHEIYPAGVTTVYDADGQPQLVVDVQVANQGTEPLSQLTVMVKVLGPEGTPRVSRRVTLDLEGVRPGIGERRTAIVEGVALEEGDEVFVELEANLPTDVLRGLPEYDEVAGAS
jgi:hypothetical protein